MRRPVVAEPVRVSTGLGLGFGSGLGLGFGSESGYLRRPVVAEPVAEVRRVVVAEDGEVCTVHEGLRHQPGVIR